MPKTLWTRIVLWIVDKACHEAYDHIWNDGFESGEEHALQRRGRPGAVYVGKLYDLTEPQEGSQWGIGSGGNA